jgi:DNA-binding transcriptional MerR regulator
MTITQMSRLFGVSLRTLRLYEDRTLIRPRREGDARFFVGPTAFRWK